MTLTNINNDNKLQDSDLQDSWIIVLLPLAL